MKQKVIFKCQQCGYNSSKWLGKCPECDNWNTFVEEKEVVGINKILVDSDRKATKLKDTTTSYLNRLQTNVSEVDRILGGGMVPGSVILLGGAPGIGKSTLLLQLADSVSEKVLYISGEESLSQIKLRSMRLDIDSDDVFVLSSDNIYSIEKEIKSIKPKIVIVDSIQTIYHPELAGIPGSVGQIREVTSSLVRIAKNENIVIFLVGHVTKEGSLAGPKVLEHVVDVVLYFEDEDGLYRIIRCFKNRFGASSEIAVFEMTQKGLIELDDPERIFYVKDEEDIPGTVLSSVVEGTRPITIEIQALVVKTNFGMARRQVSGIDINRLNFLVAVIEKRLGVNLGSFDIFVNVVGGMKIKEPAIDCAIVTAILSSFFDITIPKTNIYIGEVGLGGEIRDIVFLDERLSRSEKLGIKECFIPRNRNKSKKVIKMKRNIVKDISELLRYIKSLKVERLESRV